MGKKDKVLDTQLVNYTQHLSTKREESHYKIVLWRDLNLVLGEEEEEMTPQKSIKKIVETSYVPLIFTSNSLDYEALDLPCDIYTWSE